MRAPVHRPDERGEGGQRDSRDYPMHRSRRCGARTRRGTPCAAPAMRNGRCRMHGGSSLAGKESPRYKHGWYTQSAIAQRKETSALLRSAREALRDLH